MENSGIIFQMVKLILIKIILQLYQQKNNLEKADNKISSKDVLLDIT